jgi:hypothetical protein
MTNHEPQSLEELSKQDRQPNFILELWQFLRHSKKWWLFPVVAAVLLLGLLMFLSGSVAAPFIYPFF